MVRILRKKPNRFVSTSLIVLFVVLIMVLVSSLIYIAPQSITTPDEHTNYIVGEQQEFNILMKTVNPSQFKTADHYREQYGRWRLEDDSGKLLSYGKVYKLYNGVYDADLTITVPASNSHLVAEIVEYQFSRSGEDGSFIMDKGTIRENATIEVPVQTCDIDSDCKNGGNLCYGQVAGCKSNMCQALGECQPCQTSKDCPLNNECIRQACYKIGDKEASILDAFGRPLTQPSKAQGDRIPMPKIASQYLIYAVMIMWVILLVMGYRKVTRGKVL